MARLSPKLPGCQLQAEPLLCRALHPMRIPSPTDSSLCCAYAGLGSLCSPGSCSLSFLPLLLCPFTLSVSVGILAPTTSDAAVAMQGCPFSKTKSSCHGFALRALPRRSFKEQTELGKKVLSIRMSVWISALGHSLWTIWGEKFLFTKANESTLPKARAATQSGHVSEPRLSKGDPPPIPSPAPRFLFEAWLS